MGLAKKLESQYSIALELFEEAAELGRDDKSFLSSLESEIVSARKLLKSAEGDKAKQEAQMLRQEERKRQMKREEDTRNAEYVSRRQQEEAVWLTTILKSDFEVSSRVHGYALHLTVESCSYSE